MTPTTPPRNNAELLRQVTQRITRLENKPTVRVGDWVLSTDSDGQLVVTAPGKDALVVGAPPSPKVLADATRGFVTAERLAETVTGAPVPLDAVTAYLTDQWNKTVAILQGFSDGTTVPDLTTWINSVFGAPGSNSVPSNFSSMQAAITALQQAANPGQSDLIDFSTLPSTTNLPSMFTQIYTGLGIDGYGVQGGRAKLTSVTLPMTARSTSGRFNIADTNTDTQLVIGTWTKGPVHDGFGHRASVFLKGRVNSADNSGILCELKADSVELSCLVAGVKTIFSTLGNGGAGFFYFKPGALYGLECGTPGTVGAGDRVFTVIENGAPLFPSFTDGSAVSQVGSGYRGSDVGAAWPDSGGNVTPGEMLWWGRADN